MNPNCTIKAPFFEIGPKAYLYGDDLIELAIAATDAWVDNVNSGKSWASAFSENDMYEGEDTKYVKVTPGKTYTINFDYGGGGDGYAYVAYSQSINQKTPDIIDL